MASLESIEAQNNQIISSLGEMKDKVDKIDRGMYGDEDNQQPGLIQRQALDEKRLKKIEGKQTKNAIILAAILATATFLMNGGLDILNNIFGK